MYVYMYMYICICICAHPSYTSQNGIAMELKRRGALRTHGLHGSKGLRVLHQEAPPAFPGATLSCDSGSNPTVNPI